MMKVRGRKVAGCVKDGKNSSGSAGGETDCLTGNSSGKGVRQIAPKWARKAQTMVVRARPPRVSELWID